jgi:acetylornithine/succinyldiaminopimelate/putrescine aminotransferase
LRFGLPFPPPKPPEEIDMTHATHPYDALMDITTRPQTVFVRGEGAYLWDDSGKRYLDFMQGWAVNCLGHSPAIVADALAAQATLLLTPSPAFYNGGGVPLAALLATEHASCFAHGDQGGTFNGNPLMCAAGLAVLETVSQPQFLKAAVDAGHYLEGELQRLSARHGLGEVRGQGLLLALDLKRPIAAAIVALALEDGVLLNAPRPDTLRFMPALNVTREEIAQMIAYLDATLGKLGAARCVG